MLVLREGCQRSHVFNELIKAAGAEVAKTSRSFCCQAVATMIISVNDKFSMHQRLGELHIAADVLAESMGGLNDSPNIVLPAPCNTRNGKAVSACKLESLRF